MYSPSSAKVPLFDVTGDGENDDVFVVELCSRLRPVTYVSGQFIYQRGEIGRHMYILAVGCVEVLDQNLETVHTRLARAHTSARDASSATSRRENLRAQGHVEVCQLLSHDIDVLLDTYPHLQRALAEAYFKRKALFMRFEEARAFNPSLTFRAFLAREMSKQSGRKIDTDEKIDDGQETDWLVKTERDSPGKGRVRGRLPSRVGFDGLGGERQGEPERGRPDAGLRIGRRRPGSVETTDDDDDAKEEREGGRAGDAEAGVAAGRDDGEAKGDGVETRRATFAAVTRMERAPKRNSANERASEIAVGRRECVWGWWFVRRRAARRGDPRPRE